MLSPWEITVARAVPGAPKWNPAKNTTSSTMFATQATATKYRGRTESP